MTINHRQIVRHVGYLATHPRTRKVAVILSALVFVASIGIGSPSYAANLTKTITTKADFELGTLGSLDSEANLDKLQLETDGAWGAFSWAEPFDTIEVGSAFASDGTYVYAARGSSHPWFWRYDPATNKWARLADAPYAFGIGSDLRFSTGSTIYAAFGLYTKKFASYNIATNTWTELADTPDVVGNGGSLTYDGTNLYLLRGYSSQDFYRYNIALNTWTVLAGVTSTISNGADLVAGENGYLYAFRGTNTLSFYRYDIAAGTWSDPLVADLPSGALMNGDGNAVLVNGYIYKLRSANQRTWYRYSIAGDSWEQLVDAPLTINNAGLIYVSGQGKIYVFRGVSTRTFWAWDPGTSDWVGAQEPNISGTAYTNGTGSNLISDGSQYVYYLRGANTNGLLRYDTVANSWTAMANGLGTFNTDTFGVKAGQFLYFLRSGTIVDRYSIAGDSWATMAALPATVGQGGGLAYPGTGDFIYALRGNNTAGFYRYSITGNSWDDASVADLPTSPQSTLAYIGARMVSDGTDLYALIGYGSSRMLKYTIGTNTWSEIASAPFAAYYGTALDYSAGKIYALAGYYKDDFYEYNVSGNSWRKLHDTQVTNTANAGAYNGASLAILGSTIYATRGAAVLANTDFWTYSISANDFVTSGTYTSQVFDFSYVTAWVSLTSETTAGGDSAVLIETRSSADNVSWSSYQALSGTNIQSDANRYLQVRVTLTASTDRTVSPTLSAYTVTYTSDETAPTNPTSTTGSSQEVGGTAITSGNSYSHAAPYFTWSGASDGGSGLKGYYVYFGTNASADPETAGVYTGNAFYEVNTAMTTGNYYLRIKTVDQKDNVSATAYDGFTYVYNGVSPYQTTEITSQAQFDTGVLTNVSSSQSANNLQLETTAGLWRQDSLAPPPASIYYGGGFAYVQSSNTLYTFRGNNTTTFYSYDVTNNTWATETASDFGTVQTGGGVVEGPTDYLYGWRGINTATFARYTISTQTWDDSAAADFPLTVSYGGFAKYDGSRYIYFTRGNNDDAFWRYDTQDNGWTTLANAEFGNGANQNIYIDGGIAYDGIDTLYIIQGNNYNTLAKYTISTNTWTPLKPAPVGFYNGATLVYDATTNALYGLAGNSRGMFLKYDIGTDSWEILQDPPLFQGYGATQRIIGRNIYTLRGQNTTTFWKYNIDTGLWTKPVMDVFGQNYAGTIYRPTSYGASTIQGDGNYIYASRGNADNLFIRYDRTTGEVVPMADIPHGMITGATLAYNGDDGEIYATTGNTRNFYKYTIATNSWEEITTDLLPYNIADGSEMVYDGSGNLYLSRVNGAGFWKYDIDGTPGSRWTQMTNSTGTPGAGGSIVRNGSYIYMIRGSNTASFYRYDIGANTWSDPLVADAPVNVTTGGFLADGANGYLYLSPGTTAPGNRWYRYDIAGDSWSQLNDSPASWGAGSDGVGKNGEQLIAFLGNGTNAIADALYTYTQQTSTTSFKVSGSYTSAAHSLTSVYKWANLTVNYTQPANTTITVKTQSSVDGSTDWSSLTEATNRQRLVGTDTYTYEIASPARAYLRVEITMTSDGLYTPTVNDYSINYYQDTADPSNPSAITVYDSAAQNTALTTDTWYNHTAPRFTWSGASDNAGGSGVEGYYLYLGNDSNADPTITSGIINVGSAVQFQTSAVLTLAQSMSSGTTYYFRVKTRDNAQNISDTAWPAFIYKFDSAAPTNPSLISVNPAGFSAVDSFAFNWNTGSDAASGLQKYQYRTGGDAENAWTDMSPLTGLNVTLPNGNHAQGQYQSGANVFYLRTVDNAGNASAPLTANYYYSGAAPTPPQNLSVAPGSSTTNSFTADWDPPQTYVGDVNNIKYKYSVNALPTANNVTTIVGVTSVGPSSLATQQGQNTFYVVAEDEASNVDYDLYASATFTANTSAPGTPQNLRLADTSDRDQAQYSIAVKWDVPSSLDQTDFAGYKIFRSSDGSSFSQIATTTGTAYVDDNLSNATEYYYKVSAYSKSNAESSQTTAKKLKPTGKFTAAPTISNTSVKTTVYARRIKFQWITTRSKGDGSGTSFAKCGLDSDHLDITAGDFAQVVEHTVTTEGLTPSTAYECYLYSTDIDGNTGIHGPIKLTTAPPPSVGDVTISDIGLSKARISFTTSVEAKGKMSFGETSAFGNIKEFTNFEKEFSVELNDLKSGTTYFYGFEMTTVDGDVFAQEVINKFDTLPQPTVASVQVEPVLNVDTPTLKVTFTSNVLIRPTVYLVAEGVARRETSNTDPLATTHSITVDGLLPTRSYQIEATGYDAFGNRAISQTVYATTKDDTKPPEVLEFVTDSRPQTDGKTIIVAKVQTNEPTTAQIELATGSSSTNFSITSQESSLNQSHTQNVSVNAGQVYTVRVKLADSAGNVTYTKAQNVSGGIRKPTPGQIISRTLTKNFSWIRDLWR